ncbi:MAG: ATP-binding cassette domain-containing protein [Nitriliruptoraceae bacterium]|nr:ATP-binding cassette domain-containing protein [Nitriliruptoraceae bacterium]
MPTPPHPQDPIVEVHDLVHTFGRDIRALDGVSLAFDAGMVYALLGPNGAGKTTLIRVLATLLRPDSGSAQVAGVDVLAHPTRARTRIGLAGQFAAVDDYLTGRENVRMIGRLYGLSGAEAKRRADDILEGIGLTDAASRAVKTYSGGMRRRLDLAASLVGRPQVLFLDEPTTGIDPRNRADLWTLIRQLVDDGTTVLLTTQYLEEADRLAERIGVIDHGRIISEGTSDELKDTLGGAMLELSVEPEHREAAQGLLRDALGDEPVLDPETERFRVTAPDGTRSLLVAIRALDAAGIEPDDVRLIKPTLDDVFLQLTDTDVQPEVAS